MESHVLQLYNRGKWWDAAEVTFSGEQMDSAVTITYLNEYISSSTSYDAKDNSA